MSEPHGQGGLAHSRHPVEDDHRDLRLGLPGPRQVADPVDQLVTTGEVRRVHGELRGHGVARLGTALRHHLPAAGVSGRLPGTPVPDLLAQEAQCRERLGAPLASEHPFGVLEDGERLVPPPRQVQGPHQQLPQVLAQRVFGDQAGQLGHRLGVPVEGDAHLVAVTQRRQPLLRERARRPGHQGRGPEASQRVALPQGEGLTEPGQGALGVPLAGGHDQSPEAVQVDRLRRGLQLVSVRVPGDAHLAQRPPQRRHVDGHRLGGRSRRRRGPHRLDQVPRGNGLAEPEQQRREDSALTRRTKIDRSAVANGRDASQQAERQLSHLRRHPPFHSRRGVRPPGRPVGERSESSAVR